MNIFTKRHYGLVIAGLSLMLMTPMAGLAQDPKNWEKEGGIPNAEIEIVKDEKPTVPFADRNFEKIPPRPVEVIKHEIVYDFRNLKFNTSDYSPLIRPLKLKAEDISKIYGNYISAGVGNYASPYLEGYFNSKRDKNRLYGVHFFHHSFGRGPVDGKNSASGSTEVSAFGKSITNSVVASGNITYENRTTNFYGYIPGSEPYRPDLEQWYNNLSLSAKIENSKPSDLSYFVQGSFSHLDNKNDAFENEVALNGGASYKISEKSRFMLNADYFLITRTDSIFKYKARNLVKVQPAYLFTPIDNLLFTAGLNVAVEDDVGGKVRIYPNIRANYTMSESVSVYAALTGDIEKVTMNTLTRENLWVAPALNIRHTNKTSELMAGIKGKLAGQVSFGTGFSVATLSNLYYFRNITRAKFDVQYVNTTRLNLFAELGFNPGANVKMAVRADYYGYSTDVWHRPTYRLTFNSSYNIVQKLLLNIDLIAQGGMKTYDNEKTSMVTIPGAADLNVKADYLLSRKVSAFLKFNNILSNNYQLYLHYPVRGFQVMGGLTWTF